MLDLTSLKKAVASLERLSSKVTDQALMEGLDPDLQEGLRAGLIQNFEFTYELCWKFIRRWLRENLGASYVDGLSRKDLFRMAAENRLVDDVKTWWGFHKARNLTSHVYDEKTAEEVYQAALAFLGPAKALLETLEKRND